MAVSNFILSWADSVYSSLQVYSYEVQLKNSAGQYQNDTSLCDGSDQAVIASKTCTIAATSLFSSPYDISKFDGYLNSKIRVNYS